MNRFFLDPNQIHGTCVNFPPDLSHQILNVLRLESERLVEVLDNCGGVYLVSLQINKAGKQVTGQIVKSQPIKVVPQFGVSLFFGLTNREKVEWILQKGTEIGISNFYPFVSSRTLVQSLSLTEKKVDRWERIIREAAEQSGRIWLPELHPVGHFDESLEVAVHNHDVCLIAWEQAGDESKTLRNVLSARKPGKVGLFVGPEGGFSEDEINAAKGMGLIVSSLGDGILRMETAAVVFPALVLYELGMSQFSRL
jgi:16S rRNA (uracil1498-N3)-methyltransferase